MIKFLCIISYLLSIFYLFLCFDSKMDSYLFVFWNNYLILYAPVQRHLWTRLCLLILNSTIEVALMKFNTFVFWLQLWSQKYRVSGILGIRNIRIKFRLMYFIIYFFHYFFLTKPQYAFDFRSLDQSQSQNIRVSNLISAIVYSRILN